MEPSYYPFCHMGSAICDFENTVKVMYSMLYKGCVFSIVWSGIGYNGFPRGCSDDKLPWAKVSIL